MAYGLAVTTPDLQGENIQWGYPNVWAPLMGHILPGIEAQGYELDAMRLRLKWLSGIVLASERGEGKWPEKISGIEDASTRVDDDRYAHQENATWTQGVYMRMVADVERFVNNINGKNAV